MGLADKAIAALVRGGRIANVIERQFANKVAGPIGRGALKPKPLILSEIAGIVKKGKMNPSSSMIMPRWYMMPHDIRYSDGGKRAYWGGVEITDSLKKRKGIPWGTQASEWNLLRSDNGAGNIINDNPLTDTSWQWRNNGKLGGLPTGPDMRPYGPVERDKGKEVLGATAIAAGMVKKAVDYFANMKDSYENKEEASDE